MATDPGGGIGAGDGPMATDPGGGIGAGDGPMATDPGGGIGAGDGPIATSVPVLTPTRLVVTAFRRETLASTTRTANTKVRM